MIVTTFSPAGYEQYGKRFIETYKEHCSYPLVVYVEDDLKIDGVEVRNLFDVPGCSQFLELIKDYKPDSYRNDVNKFCRKVFAMTDAASGFDGVMTFLGADTVFLKDIPEEFFENLVGNSYLAYLGRKQLHSETDYITFNTRHSMNRLFMILFIRIYTSGAFQALKYSCDSDVFDFVRTQLSAPAVNINKIGDENHPFVNSVLGEYMDHCKGPIRKKAGKSFEDDYVNQ